MDDKTAASLTETLNKWTGWRVFWTAGTRAIIWFLLPFGMLYSFGVDPVTAARLAVGPYLCMMLTFAAIIAGTVIGAVFAVEQSKS